MCHSLAVLGLISCSLAEFLLRSNKDKNIFVHWKSLVQVVLNVIGGPSERVQSTFLLLINREEGRTKP